MSLFSTATLTRQLSAPGKNLLESGSECVLNFKSNFIPAARNSHWAAHCLSLAHAGLTKVCDDSLFSNPPTRAGNNTHTRTPTQWDTLLPSRVVEATGGEAFVAVALESGSIYILDRESGRRSV